MRADDVDAQPETSIQERLLRRVDDLGQALAERGDAIALIGLGSVGNDLHRLDEHSDMDFFVVVEDGAKQRYLDCIDWLEAPAPVAFSFPNTVDGRKALYEDGLFAEYAVFTLAELAQSAYSPGRIIWRRDDAPVGLEAPARPLPVSPSTTVDHYVNEALTNLYVGLHRDARGERLSATRFIQSFAVDCLLAVLELSGDAAPRQDVFAIERGAERRFGADALPFAQVMPGYAHNREAAAAILGWLEQHVEVNPVMASAIRALLA